MLNNWHRVSLKEPCPICQHTDWCMLSNDGLMCICQRVESDKPTRNSGGWVHRLGSNEGSGMRDETFLQGRPQGHVPCGVNGATSHNSQLTTHPSLTTHNSSLIPQYFDRLPTTWHNAQARMCARLERDLGLPKEILMVLDWRWDAAAHAVAIPMRDAWGEVTGIRYRSLETGAKWAKRGSKDGLFFDSEFIPYDPDELVICEGPTDCAAAMACGFWAVGRSSCGTGRDAIKELIKRKGARRVTIVADADPPKPRPGGGTWQPGIEGAQRLADQLNCAYRIVLPPIGFKDLRDWYRAGTLNEKTFKDMCQGNGWHGPGGEGKRDEG